MGIILRDIEKDKSYLEKYGFKKTDIFTYEHWYKINDLYDMLVTIHSDKDEISLYVEYNCGGEVYSGSISTPETDMIEEESDFIKWLDEEATRVAKLFSF